jgi:hypothetical protein
MYPDSENFDSLRRLLGLKRHEQPPPGYFHHFSRNVIVRIQAGERGVDSTSLERLLWEAPWLQRFWTALEAKPVLAGALGVAACAMLLAGIIYSLPDNAPAPYSSASPQAMLLSAQRSIQGSIFSPDAAVDFTNGFSGDSTGSLFGQPVKQIKYILPGN